MTKRRTTTAAARRTARTLSTPKLEKLGKVLVEGRLLGHIPMKPSKLLTATMREMARRKRSPGELRRRSRRP